MQELAPARVLADFQIADVFITSTFGNALIDVLVDIGDPIAFDALKGTLNFVDGGLRLLNGLDLGRQVITGRLRGRP